MDVELKRKIKEMIEINPNIQFKVMRYGKPYQALPAKLDKEILDELCNEPSVFRLSLIIDF